MLGDRSAGGSRVSGRSEPPRTVVQVLAAVPKLGDGDAGGREGGVQGRQDPVSSRPQRVELRVDGQADDVDQVPDRLGDLLGGIAEQGVCRVGLSELVVQGEYRRGTGALAHRLGRALGLGDRPCAQPVPSELVPDLPGVHGGKSLDEGVDPRVPSRVGQGGHVVGVADLGQGQASLRVQGLHRGAPAGHLVGVGGVTDHQTGRDPPLAASRATRS